MTRAQHSSMGGQASRLPVVYLPHGGGPWPFVEMGLDAAELASLAAYLRSVRSVPQTTPKALLVISAHWEESIPTVMAGQKPPLLFDYYGFPPASYELSWPALGDTQLAARVQALLLGSGIPCGRDETRGFDHGTFVPLLLTYPQAEIPTVQLSLQKGLDPAQHVAIGKALAPLRDEGVFIIGSGMSFHNMRAFGSPRARELSAPFDAWLKQAVLLPPETRDARLLSWATAPSARQAHPREEHLLPLLVIAGAAGDSLGVLAYEGSMMGARLSAFHFGV